MPRQQLRHEMRRSNKRLVGLDELAHKSLPASAKVTESVSVSPFGLKAEADYGPLSILGNRFGKGTTELRV